MAHSCVILFCANAFFKFNIHFFLALSSLHQKSIEMTFFITFSDVISQATNISRFCVAVRLYYLCPKTLCLHSTKKQTVDCLPPLPRSLKSSPTCSPVTSSSDRWKEHGVSIPTSTVNRWVHNVADTLCPFCKL